MLQFKIQELDASALDVVITWMCQLLAPT